MQVKDCVTFTELKGRDFKRLRISNKDDRLWKVFKSREYGADEETYLGIVQKTIPATCLKQR